MQQHGIERNNTPLDNSRNLLCYVENGVLVIGQTKIKLYDRGNKAKIPDVVFFDTNEVKRSYLFISV